MIILTHGYFLQEDPREQLIMKPYPPLGILYLSAYLDVKKISHEVFDTTFSAKKTFYTYLQEKQPSILAIYINLMTKLNVLEIIQFIRSSKNLQHIKIVLGGPDVRYNKDNLLNYGADFLVIGEGEETFYELVQALQDNTDYNTISGIAFKNANGTIQTNSARILRKNLDELPNPNRHKINLQAYFDVWKKYHGYSAMTLSSMRGCPYTCHWCSRGVYGQSYRRRSPISVVEEIKQIIEQYKPDNIWFVDDVFTVSHKWLEEFTTLIEQNNIKLPYECITRADRLNTEAIQLLKRSGCFRVWIGAESGSQRIIDLMDRRVDVQKVQHMIREAQQAGIQAGTFIMLGYPSETEADIKATLRHLKRSNPEWFTITITYPIKGTELYQEVEAISSVNQLDWSQTTDRDIDFKKPYSKKYYEYAMQWITSEMDFYQRKRKKLPFTTAIKAKARSIQGRLGMMIEKQKRLKQNLV